MAVSEELQAQINDAVRIVAEDRLWSAIQGKLAPADPPPGPDDDGSGKPPPPKPDGPADGTDSEPKSRGGLWWKEVGSDDVEPAPDGS